MIAILQITLRSLKFVLALVTSDNKQVSIYETLSPGICLRRASVTLTQRIRLSLHYSLTGFHLTRWAQMS